MENKIIFLRKPLTKQSLRYHLRNLFKNEDMSGYIALQTRFSDNKLTNQPLGRLFYIHLETEGEKAHYINYLIEIYSSMSKSEVKKIKSLSFHIAKATEKEHETFLSKSI